MGDTAAWTGHLLAALVHKYAVDRNVSVLPHITAMLQALDFVTANCTSEVTYVHTHTHAYIHSILTLWP